MNEPANDNHLQPWKLIEGEALAVLASLPTNSVDCIATDPPYSSGGLHLRARQQSTSEKYVMRTSGADHPEFTGDSRDQRSFAYWCQLWTSECLRISKPGATMLVFSDWRQLATTIDAVQAGGWTFTGVAPWDKTEGARPRMGGMKAQAEYIIHATKGRQDQGPELRSHRHRARRGQPRRPDPDRVRARTPIIRRAHALPGAAGDRRLDQEAEVRHLQSVPGGHRPAASQPVIDSGHG